MNLVFYSVVLNHHQAPVADEFYKLLGDDYCFVELFNLGETKGGGDFSSRPYLLRAWESEDNHHKAMQLAQTADCCVFGPEALEYEIERMKLGLLSFDMGERWLKQGWKNLLSPRLIKWHMNYHLRGWKRKPLYKLCMSAFAARDHQKLGAFKGKCYKWGYFTSVRSYENDLLTKTISDENEILTKTKTDFALQNNKKQLEQGTGNREPNAPVRLMWCARFLQLKHPEYPILIAQRLKSLGYHFQLDMYGDGPLRAKVESVSELMGQKELVRFHGNVPNEEVLKAMDEHDIFLFTSNRLEGWGAVVNEAMSHGCAIVGSDAIGSIPYLVEDGANGLWFKSEKVASLFEKIQWLMDHPDECHAMGLGNIEKMQTIWSPKNAAKNFLQLISDLSKGRESSIIEGPCSKA